MATDLAAPVANPVQHRDANVMIGILAILEGVISGGQLDEQTTSKVAARFEYGTPPSSAPVPP